MNAKAPNTGGTFLGLSQLALHGDAVPEPATASLGLLGLAALLLRRRV
ncbi:PEP-CTERM sorting domain-containing protein [Akkermansia muciniphila]